MDVADNEELLAAAARGDQAAWEALVLRHNRLLWSVARGFRLDTADAGDAIQTTWLRLVENLDRIKDPARLAGWLSTTLRNECLRLLRRAGRERPDGTVDRLAERPDDSEPLDTGLLTGERNAALWAAFSRMSTRCQQVLRALTTDPPLTYLEISELLDMPIGSIGPSRARCLEQLRRTAELV